jgi:hypothetical protein
MTKKPTKKEWMKFAGDVPDSFAVTMLDEIKPDYLTTLRDECERIGAPKSVALIEVLLKRKVGEGNG